LRGRFHRQVFDNDNDQSNSNNTLYGEYQLQQEVDLLGQTMITAGVVGRSTNSVAELYRGGLDGSDRNSSSNLAGYLQLDKKLFDKLALSLGMRYEQFKVNDADTAQPVFRAGATYQVHKATYLRASYGQGFRYPTIGERYIRTALGVLNIYPNPELRAEQSWNVEAGIKQGFKLGNFMGYLDVVVFRQDFQDYVEFTFGQWVPPTPTNLGGFGFKSVNTGGARVSGYEFEVVGKGSVGKVDLTLLMGYTHTLPVSTTPDQVYATAVTSNTPPSTYRNTSYDPTDNILKFRVQNLQTDYKRLMAGVSFRYNSHVRNIDRVFVDLDEANFLSTGIAEWMPEHTTGDLIVDVRVGVDLTEVARVAVIVNNLTNEVYSLRPLSIEAPRSVQVQLTVNL
jgi:iron complex outermembrane receptor protein